MACLLETCGFAVMHDDEHPPEIDGMLFVGWLCQWGEKGAPDRRYHSNWATNRVMDYRGLLQRPRQPGDPERCPSCRPVYVLEPK